MVPDLTVVADPQKSTACSNVKVRPVCGPVDPKVEETAVERVLRLRNVLSGRLATRSADAGPRSCTAPLLTFDKLRHDVGEEEDGEEGLVVEFTDRRRKSCGRNTLRKFLDRSKAFGSSRRPATARPRETPPKERIVEPVVRVDDPLGDDTSTFIEVKQRRKLRRSVSEPDMSVVPEPTALEGLPEECNSEPEALGTGVDLAARGGQKRRRKKMRKNQFIDDAASVSGSSGGDEDDEEEDGRGIGSTL